MDEETVRRAAADDPVYHILMAKVVSGDRQDSKFQEIQCLRPFCGVRERLAVNEGLLTYIYDQGNTRLFIPDSLRNCIASTLHAGHQRLVSMVRRARQAVYWPGMKGDLQHHRATCKSCDIHSPSLSAEPMVLTPPPDYPFQHTVVDMFQWEGHTYMACVERLTGWLEVAHFPNSGTSSKIQTQLRRYFARCGAHEQISTDGGTNSASAEMENYKN